MFIKKMNKAVILLALLSISAFAQGTFTDSRDGKKYKSVKIGTQTWMAQNLDYQGEDGKLGVCYDNKPENCTKYGGLYNWAEAVNIDAKFNKEKWDGDTSDVKHQGICPSGWHLPNAKEWSTLSNFAGGQVVDAYIFAGKKLKAKSGWNKDGNKNSNGTDNYGFSALPAGGGGWNKDVASYEFSQVGSYSSWWIPQRSGSRDGGRGSEASIRFMDLSGGLGFDGKGKSYLASVRCLQD